jgi:hypothetical protein
MQNGPEHPVGISIVIFLKVFLAQVGEHIRLVTVRNGLDAGIRSGGNPAAPAKPDSGMPSQDRANRDSKAARAASAVAARDRDTIGDYDQPFQITLQWRQASGQYSDPLHIHTYRSRLRRKKSALLRRPKRQLKAAGPSIQLKRPEPVRVSVALAPKHVGGKEPPCKCP